MKFSESWLRQYVDPKLSTTELTDQMSMMGLTVDHIYPVAGKFSNVVIGKVISTKPHPDATKLTCCIVNIGEKENLKIVCGAPNVRADLTVAVAKVGAVLPNGMEIKAVKLRGEESCGMLCSAKELELHSASEDQPGILELSSDAPIGMCFRKYFEADDHIIDVEITPNRGDCLSVLGIARDIAAKNNLKINCPHPNPLPITGEGDFKINIFAHSDCPKYIGRKITHINNTVSTPFEIQKRLQRAGIRLINPVVDICNYVMCEMGQPMHAFDYAKLYGNIEVRKAKPNEKIKLLDEQEIILSSEDLVIADKKNAHCLAGIMGGLESAVSEKTTEIFLEAAFFTAKTICLSTRRHNTRSDSSYRFERGVDFNLPEKAMERATNLILEITGGKAGEAIKIISEKDLPKREKIILRIEQIKRILGIEFSESQIETVLKSLGMLVSKTKTGFEVVPPSYRFDITLEVDLIEECARILGYEHIPVIPMAAPLVIGKHTEKKLSQGRIRAFFADHAYQECITYSFISLESQQLFFPDEKYVALNNPLSSDLAIMRTSLLPGLLNTLEMNSRQQRDRMRLFELGMCFTEENQIPKLACVITGCVDKEQWNLSQEPADFYDLKSDITAFLSLLKNKNFSWIKAENAAFHPGRCAALCLDNKPIGFLGEIHPMIIQKLGLRHSAIAFEVILEAMTQAKIPEFAAFSRFPSVRRDIAVVIDEMITAEQLQASIYKHAGIHLNSVEIFDVYRGSGIDTGKKSIALGLTFQDASRTLRDEEINEIIQNVVKSLKQELQATLRA